MCISNGKELPTMMEQEIKSEKQINGLWACDVIHCEDPGEWVVKIGPVNIPYRFASEYTLCGGHRANVFELHEGECEAERDHEAQRAEGK